MYLIFPCCFRSLPAVPIDQEPKTHLKLPKKATTQETNVSAAFQKGGNYNFNKPN